MEKIQLRNAHSSITPSVSRTKLTTTTPPLNYDFDLITITSTLLLKPGLANISGYLLLAVCVELLS